MILSRKHISKHNGYGIDSVVDFIATYIDCILLFSFELQIQPPMSTNTKASKHKIQQVQTLDKLSMEDAKRAALSDFEENRNMAMHHAHLKV